MTTKTQKLELTWIGKDNQPRLEPRILIEDTEKSYGYKNSENMLIHGDNLLALKALEQDFAGEDLTTGYTGFTEKNKPCNTGL